MDNTNKQTNKPLSLLTKELEEGLVNTINTYTSILHPSIIELIVEKVYTNVGQFTEQHTKREQIAYEKALAEQELSQESTEK